MHDAARILLDVAQLIVLAVALYAYCRHSRIQNQRIATLERWIMSLESRLR